MRTVDNRLSSVYHKLGIGGRDELRDLLGFLTARGVRMSDFRTTSRDPVSLYVSVRVPARSTMRFARLVERSSPEQLDTQSRCRSSREASAPTSWMTQPFSSGSSKDE